MCHLTSFNCECVVLGESVEVGLEKDGWILVQFDGKGTMDGFKGQVEEEQTKVERNELSRQKREEGGI